MFIIHHLESESSGRVALDDLKFAGQRAPGSGRKRRRGYSETQETQETRLDLLSRWACLLSRESLLMIESCRYNNDKPPISEWGNGLYKLWWFGDGWWFGTFIFPCIGNFIIPTDFHILRRGSQDPVVDPFAINKSAGFKHEIGYWDIIGYWDQLFCFKRGIKHGKLLGI